MKKISINYRSPRYVLPLIILPFLVAINWVVLDTFPAEGGPPAANEAFNRLNTKIPEARLYKEDVSSKFEAIKEAFKGRLGLSAISGLEKRDQTLHPGNGQPNLEEKVNTDSIREAINDGTAKGVVGGKGRVRVQGIPENRRFRLKSPGKAPAFKRVPAKGLAGNYGDQVDNLPEETAEEREMRIWKTQMLLLDSLTKTPAERAAEQAIKRKTETLKALAEIKAREEQKTVEVSKAGKENGQYFNTIGKKEEEVFIKAIIDEDIKVVAGSRVRIRIMDAMDVGGYLLEKGSCIYAKVSSFSGRRVHLTVGSVLVGNRIRKVDLKVYDNDGIQGLYVPKSKFTAFTKDLGSNLSTGAASDISVEQKPGSLNQLLFGMAETGVQATSKAAGKAAKKNRAKLKYNTILYLVNADKT